MSKQKHIHKYRRALLGRKNDYPLFKCILPGCTHNMQPQLMIGIQAICYNCDTPFYIVSKDDLIEKLKCKRCRELPPVSSDEVLELLEKLEEK